MLATYTPFLRYIAKSTYFLNDMVIANDCHITYIISGEGHFLFNGKAYHLSPGTFLYSPCGKAYQFFSDTENPLLFYTINFDFSQENSHITAMRPQKSDSFDADLLLPIPKYISEIFYDIIYLSDGTELLNDITGIYQESLNINDDNKYTQSMYLSIMISKLIRLAASNSKESLACKKIKEMVTANPSLSTKEIAENLNYHPYYLNNLFSKNTGITLHKYIMHQRLICAREMLLNTNAPIEEIAHSCGFCSQSHFSSAFNRLFNITPGKIRCNK